MISIDGLAAFRARLDALQLEVAIGRGLQAAAAHVAETVRTALSTPPGGPHAAPWLREGALRASIGVHVDDAGAVIGAASDVALYQELGTARIPPRPFLAPAANQEANAAAQRVADALAAEFLSGQAIS